jgi:hypothetical protein
MCPDLYHQTQSLLVTSWRSGASLKLISAQSAPNPRSYLTCTVQLGATRPTSSLSLRSTFRHIHCSRPPMHHCTFMTGDTNEPDNTDPTIQIGWFLVLKGGIYYMRFSSELKDLTRNIILACDGRVNLLHFSGGKAILCGKIGVDPNTPLPPKTLTTLARARHR